MKAIRVKDGLFRSAGEVGGAARRKSDGKSLRDFLRWQRIPNALRYLRRYGLLATLARLFPQLKTYSRWIKSYDRLSRGDIRAIRQHIAALRDRPLLSVIMPIGNGDAPTVLPGIARLYSQLYPDWELCVGAGPADAAAIAADRGAADTDHLKIARTPASASAAARANAALGTASGRFVLLLSPEDRLAEHALYMVAAEIAANPDAVMIYSDEDKIDTTGRRRDPRFKSDWSQDMLLGNNMVGRLAAYRRAVIDRIGGWRPELPGSAEYDLALRVIEFAAPEQLRHIPMVLYHRALGSGQDGSPEICEARLVAAREHLDRTGAAAVVTALEPGCQRVRYPVPEPNPGVSLIVPTRDRVELLRRCVGGLLDRTDYANIELIIVDNDSKQPDTHAYLAGLATDPRVNILQYPGPFNYATINNFAIARAKYEIVGLINNDVEVISSDWLREMVSQILRPQVGAVGAKLYYPNDTIQHAGIIIGLGGAAGHAFRHFGRAERGYLNRLMVVQDLSAVTAACMLVKKTVFDLVGGLDAANLAVAFNDVDLCLRIRECGYRIVWTPFAELYHRESVSRESDFAADQIARFRREAAYLQQRWGDVIAHDPYYNPNLSVQGEDFGLAFPPRVSRPWREHTSNRKHEH